MAELKDVVNELITETEKGQIQWTPDVGYWSSKLHNCSYTVFRVNPRLMIGFNDNGVYQHFNF